MIHLPKEVIDNIFVEACVDGYHQQKALIALYKVAFPNWDNIRKLSGWPKISVETWKYIHSKFSPLDRKYHPNCMAGGLWFNSGFGNDKTIADWMIAPIEPEKILYKNQKNRIQRIYIYYSWYEDKKADTKELITRIQFVRPFELGTTKTWFYPHGLYSLLRVAKLAASAQEAKLDAKNQFKEYILSV